MKAAVLSDTEFDGPTKARLRAVARKTIRELQEAPDHEVPYAIALALAVACDVAGIDAGKIAKLSAAAYAREVAAREVV